MKISISARVKKWLFLWSRRPWLPKRQQFVLATVALSAGLLLTQLVSLDLRYPLVFVLAIAAYGLSAFVLRDDLHSIEWLTLLALPTLFTAAVAMFYFLLPVRWLTRLPVAVLYGVGMYALLLTENIYSVAAERTIALLRAAHSVGFLLTLLTYFLLTQTVLAFRFYPVINAILIGLVSFVLVLQSLWAMELTSRVSRRVRDISIAVTLFLINVVWIFSFFPTTGTIKALLFTTFFYSSVGIAQQYLVEKLYKKTLIDFTSVVIIVFCIALIATNWRGNG